jgi:hypothetical protein
VCSFTQGYTEGSMYRGKFIWFFFCKLISRSLCDR